MNDEKQRDLGLLVLRAGIGAMFVGHGLPKLLGGPQRWTTVGEAMAYLGLDFASAACCWPRGSRSVRRARRFCSR